MRLLFPIVCLVICAASSVLAQTADPLPLHAGSYWIYRGKVKWGEGNLPREAVIDWKVEVVRVVRVGRFVVAVMKGDFEDLTSYKPGKARSGYLIVKDGGKYYRIDPCGLDLNQLLSDAAELESNLAFDILFLDMPLTDGKCFGQDPSLPRKDSMFCWAVQKAPAVRFQGKQYPGFTLTFRTIPDTTRFSFAAGLGFTHYEYEHPETANEVSVNLEQYHP